MPSSHSLDAIAVTFDDQRAVANAGLIAPASLAQHLGLRELFDELVDLGEAAGRANVGLKAMTLIESALAGGECIDDADRMRVASTPEVLGHTVPAPSTLGTFLRSFTWGHVAQLDRVLDESICRAWAAGAGPGDGPVTVDVDSTICETYGLAKQGSRFGHTKVLPLVQALKHRTRLQPCGCRGPGIPWEVGAVAWMRMMGRESVEYHRATVLERGDDFPGRALAYYTPRGEIPLAWGGAGVETLRLEGAVTPEAYEAIFGGAGHPHNRARLVSTQRPGMELVISAHKSVAELGVTGRAEHMHLIMDAERDATLTYLDRVTGQMGGRRGRAATVTATGGLVYAHTRHATSRAGDPCPHDHVLLTNVVQMLDDKGGWKAADTALWREHLHAATMIGRAAAARVAVELGYTIEADSGPSGRLGH